MIGKRLRLLAAVITVLVFGATIGIVLAVGTESLGAPGVSVGPGSGAVAAGTGMHTQPGVININVPGSAVNQALLYWGDRFDKNLSPDDTITIDGNSVTGTQIGGPTTPVPPSDVVSVAFRADITGLSLVSTGANTLELKDLSVDGDEDGAGVVVIFDDGTTADIQLVDGSDYANSGLNPSPPLSDTVPQTFSFAAEASGRTADLLLFVTDVTPGRTTRVNISIDGGLVIQLDNPLASNDGAQFDTLTIPVPIPAGATSLTVEIISGGPSGKPSSLNWIMATLSLPITPEGGGEGCTPGFWKNHIEDWGPSGLDPGASYAATFGIGAPAGIVTLEDAVNAKGGGAKKLARHGTAALISALHPGVDYPFTAAEVIALVQAGDADALADANELGCEID